MALYLYCNRLRQLDEKLCRLPHGAKKRLNLKSAEWKYSIRDYGYYKYKVLNVIIAY